MDEKKIRGYKRAYIFVTIILFLILIFGWSLKWISPNDFNLLNEIQITLFVAIAIIAIWASFSYQIKADKNPRLKNTKTYKAFEYSNKYLGIGHIFNIVGAIIFGIGALIIAIYIFATTPRYWYVGVFLIIVAFLMIILVKNQIKMSKTRLSGRFH